MYHTAELFLSTCIFMSHLGTVWHPHIKRNLIMMLCGCSRCTNIYPQVLSAWLPNYAVMICSIVLMKSCATGELRLVGETVCAAERLN